MREYINKILQEIDSEINNSVLSMMEMVALMLKMDFAKKHSQFARKVFGLASKRVFNTE